MMESRNLEPATLGTPQGDAGENTSYKLTIVIIVLFFLETAAVALRIASRRLQGLQRNWADFLIPAAWVFNIGLFICSQLSIENGSGTHVWTIPEDRLIRFLVITHYPEPIIYLFAITLPKLAILEIYIQVFVLERIPRYICYFVGVILVVNVAVNFPIILAQCQPMAALWDRSAGHCTNAQKLFMWAGIPNISTDVVMMLLPLPIVWKLQASKRIKWGLFTTFFVGSIGLVFSCVRFVGFNTNFDDGTFIAPELNIAANVEPGVYLLSACFITFRPLFRWIANRRFLSPLLSRISKGSKYSDSLPSLPHIPTHHESGLSSPQLVHQAPKSASDGTALNGETISRKPSSTLPVTVSVSDARDDFESLAAHA